MRKTRLVINTGKTNIVLKRIIGFGAIGLMSYGVFKIMQLMFLVAYVLGPTRPWEL